MNHVDGFKRPSPSPSRCSVRSDSRVFRQPRVIQVNRDASTMMDDETSAVGGSASGAEPGCPSECGSHISQHAAHFRSRTFSDGFIRNTSLELLLGVDCEACLALAAQQHCINQPISEKDFDLVCNCNVRQNNYLNCYRDSFKQRGHTLNIYDIERIKRDTGRSSLAVGSHRSLDRKHYKSKTIGVSSYISKQFISYDPTNTLVQKIKRKLSNLKKVKAEPVAKKTQNALQLAEMASGSTNSLKRLSMLSLVDKSHRKMDSQSCILSSSGLRSKDDFKNSVTTYENFSSNIDQCFDRLRNCNEDMASQKNIHARNFENSDERVVRSSPLIKFSTLDNNRSRCRSIRRQLSCNEFPSDRFRDRVSESWTQNENAFLSRDSQNDLSEDTQTFVEPDKVIRSSARNAHAICTCETHCDNRIPSILYDAHVSSLFYLIFS